MVLRRLTAIDNQASYLMGSKFAKQIHHTVIVIKTDSCEGIVGSRKSGAVKFGKLETKCKRSS
jgi:hypothetical protein